MKNILTTISKLFAPLMVVFVLFSCGDEHEFSPYSELDSTTNARMKFYNMTVGPLGTNFSANWFINDIKTSSVLVTTGLPLGIASGGQFPSGIIYTSISSGSQTMKMVIPTKAATSTTPEVPATDVFTSPLVVEEGKNYTTIAVGASPNYSAYTVKDDVSVVTDPTKAYIRFLNLISNAPTGGYDLSIVQLNTNAVIYSGVAYLKGSEVFIPIAPVDDALTTPYEIQLRTIGTTTIVAKLATGFIPRKGKAYTVLAKGYVGGLSNGLPSTTVNIPTVDWFTNK
jgi:hypothetical protein